MTDKMFHVIPRTSENKEQAKLVEAIINQPHFTDKVIRATELFVSRFMVPEMLYGKTFTEYEKEDGMNAIIEEINKLDNLSKEK